MSNIDRKSLKRPDEFLQLLQNFFSNIATQSRKLTFMLLGLFVIVGVMTFLLQYKEGKAQKGNDALYIARQSLDHETKKLEDVEKEAQKLKTPPKPVTGKKEADKEPPAPAVSVAFKRLDVNAGFPETLKGLKDIVQNFSGTRPAFEAALLIGNLYYDHGHPSDSIEWFKKAVEFAPKSLEKVLSLSSLGYAYENTKQLDEAIQTFQKALNYGEVSAKGDLLLATARSHELLGQKDKARTLYEKVIQELPKSSYAKKAEVLRDL